VRRRVHARSKGLSGRGLDPFAEVGLGLGRDLDDWHRHIRAGRAPEFAVAPAPTFPLPLTGTDVWSTIGGWALCGFPAC
jgi:hypothetical protein